MSSSTSQKLVIITAPSGSGKTTIVNHLLAEIPTLAFSISACTRKPRGTEVDGINYHFISIEEFTHKIATHEFAEFEMVYEGKYYGTLKSELQRIWDNGQIPLVDIDVQGALRLKKHYGNDAITIFIKAPNLEILEHRLRTRGTETEDAIQERIAKAKLELSFANQFDVTITNDVIELAVTQTKETILKFI